MVNKCVIQNFLRLKVENEYFDIKAKWHKNSEDLLKDIICFCNTVHDKDCYIIFGIEDKTFNILGVGEEHRRTQADVLDALSKLKFASEERPDISVESISIEGKVIDVLTIYNTNNTPLFLEESQGKMLKGCIYARERDRNTPNNGNAKFNIIDALWRKRFGLVKTKKTYFYELLTHSDDWTELPHEFYNSYCPEYRVYISQHEEDQSHESMYSAVLMNKSVFRYKIEVRYRGELLEEFLGFSLDGRRIFMPIPKLKAIGEYDKRKFVFGYFIKNESAYKLLSFFFEKNTSYKDEFCNSLLKDVILFFETSIEMDEFLKYINNNFDLLNTEADNISNLKKGAYGKEDENMRYAYALNKMLRDWRLKIAV